MNKMKPILFFLTLISIIFEPNIFGMALVAYDLRGFDFPKLNAHLGKTETNLIIIFFKKILADHLKEVTYDIFQSHGYTKFLDLWQQKSLEKLRIFENIKESYSKQTHLKNGIELLVPEILRSLLRLYDVTFLEILAVSFRRSNNMPVEGPYVSTVGDKIFLIGLFPEKTEEFLLSDGYILVSEVILKKACQIFLQILNKALEIQNQNKECNDTFGIVYDPLKRYDILEVVYEPPELYDILDLPPAVVQTLDRHLSFVIELLEDLSQPLGQRLKPSKNQTPIGAPKPERVGQNGFHWEFYSF